MLLLLLGGGEPGSAGEGERGRPVVVLRRALCLLAHDGGGAVPAAPGELEVVLAAWAGEVELSSASGLESIMGTRRLLLGLAPPPLALASADADAEAEAEAEEDEEAAEEEASLECSRPMEAMRSLSKYATESPSALRMTSRSRCSREGGVGVAAGRARQVGVRAGGGGARTRLGGGVRTCGWGSAHVKSTCHRHAAGAFVVCTFMQPKPSRQAG